MSSSIRYSLKTDANKQLSPYFRVSEFACKDGSDSVLIHPQLVEVLERVRERCGGNAITIMSAYRTEAYNAKCGGAKASQHILGTAADIKITGLAPLDVCKVCEDALAEMGIPGGVGHYPYAQGRFSHIDVRPTRARWQRDKKEGLDRNVYGFGGGEVSPSSINSGRPTLRRGDKGDDVRYLQKRLSITQDGVFGPATEAAVIAFQRRQGLGVDGVVGAKTWAKLEG